MKYTVQLTRGGCYSNCDVLEAPFPGFLTITVPGCAPEMYNIAEIRSLQPEPGESVQHRLPDVWTY